MDFFLFFARSFKESAIFSITSLPNKSKSWIAAFFHSEESKFNFVDIFFNRLKPTRGFIENSQVKKRQEAFQFFFEVCLDQVSNTLGLVQNYL